MASNNCRTKGARKTSASRAKPRRQRLREGLRKALTLYVTIAMMGTSTPIYAVEEIFEEAQSDTARVAAINEQNAAIEEENRIAQEEADRNGTTPELQELVEQRTSSEMEPAPDEPAELNEASPNAPPTQDEAQLTEEPAPQEPMQLKVETDDSNIVVRYLFGSDLDAGWTLYTDGTLAITGTGIINEARPWGEYKDQIRVVYMDQSVRTANMVLPTAWTRQAWSPCCATQC